MAKLPSVDGSITSELNVLLSEYKMLAKRADQRMVRLERASNKPEYKGILKMAYARAQHDLKAFTPEERLATGKPLRFNTSPPRNKKGEIDVPKLRRKMNILKKFLSSHTSTIKKPAKPFAGEEGVESAYQKRANTINKEYKTDFTWQELAVFFDSGLADKLQKFGSDVRLKVIAVVQANRQAVIDALEGDGNRTLVIDNNPFTKDPTKPLDPFLQRKLDEMLQDANKDLERFLTGRKKPGRKAKKKSTSKKSKKGKK